MTGAEQAAAPEIEARILDLLTRQAPSTVEGAFVYGSVAAGRARPTSDIDCFILTAQEYGAEAAARVKEAFADLQFSLGYVPDPVHPVEMFSVAACRQTLESSCVHSTLEALSSGADVGAFLDSDDAEVFRALLNERITVVNSRELGILTQAAVDVVGRATADPPLLLRHLGVKFPLRVAEPAEVLPCSAAERCRPIDARSARHGGR